LSLERIEPAANERLDGFQVTTHGIKVLALCHKAPGWIVSYGNSDSTGGGFLGGQAKLAAGDLDPTGIKGLLRLFLVIPDGQPIKLEGIVRLRNQMTGETRDLSLRSPNFELEPGEKCP
jgi:hypothetical protein